jgi:hypothetical protein
MMVNALPTNCLQRKYRKYSIFQNVLKASTIEKRYLMEVYRDSHGTWIYPELPDTVRPATRSDLFMLSGRPNYGRRFLYWSHFQQKYVAWKILETTTVEELNLMLNDKVIYVAK